MRQLVLWALLGAFAAQGEPVPGRGASGMKACEEQLRRTPQSFGPYLCLVDEAGRGHRDEVQRVLQRVLQRDPDEPRALFYSALFRSLAGESVDEKEYAHAAVGFRREHNVTGLVWALTSQVAQRCFGGRHCDAVAETLLAEAERLAEESGDVQLKRLCQLWWAREGLTVDDISRVERGLARLDALPGEDPPWLAVQVFETRAFVAGVHHDAQEQYTLYSALLKASKPESAQRAIALGGVAGAAGRLAAKGSFERSKAEELLRQVLVDEEQEGFDLSGPDNGALATRVQLALLLGPTDEAMELTRVALARQLSRKGWRYDYYARWLLARYTIERNPADVEQALGYADAAVAEARVQEAAWEESRGQLMRAYVLWQSGQPTPARKAALAALDEMERLRRLQTELRVQMQYEDSQASAYQLVASSVLDRRSGAMTPSDIADALDVMERLRARSLLETLLHEAGDAGSERRAMARIRIEEAQSRLLDMKRSPAQRVDALDALHAAEKEEAALSATRATRATERSAPLLTDIQRALEPTEALVSFQVWRSEPSLYAPYNRASSWAVVVTRSEARAVRIPDAEELEPEINLWLGLLRRRDGSERAGGERLSEQVVQPVLAVLPREIRQLIVIPDGPLHRLPWDALPDANGTYLAERFGISLIPSAAIWLELKRRYVAQPGLALALAEPTVAPATEPLLRAALGVTAGPLPALVGAREEAQSARAAFPRGSLLLTGPSATEEFLKSSDLRPFSLLHFATHAVVDPVEPERSAIVLAPTAGQQDGLLRVEEISRLKLEQKAVVLAACSTSSGPVRRAEGVMSLARAFFEAGAQTVVGTLTPVRDAESAALFDAFYRRIADGKSIRQALLEAKRERIRAGAPPAAWAPVVVLGNDEVSPRRAEVRPTWPLASAGVGISLLLGTAVFAALRRRSPPVV